MVIKNKFRIMKKLIYIFLAGALFYSCDPDKQETAVSQGGQALAAFNLTSTQYPVPDTNDPLFIEVGISTSSPSDRSFTVSVDESSTADPSTYSIVSGSLVIPAGEYVGNLQINGSFENLPELGSVDLVINLDSVSGTELLGTRLQHTISLFRFCPFEDGNTFTGEYEITVVTPGVFDLPTYGADGGTVTLEVGSNVTERVFTANYLADDRFPREWTLGFICGDVVVVPLDTRVSCDPDTDPFLTIGPDAEAGVFNGADDSEFTVKVLDNVDSDCGSGPISAEYIFRKM